MLTFKNHEVPILHSLQLISSLEMHNGKSLQSGPSVLFPCCHQSAVSVAVPSSTCIPPAPTVAPRGKRSGGNPAAGQHSGSFPCFCGLCKSKVGTQQLPKFDYSVKMIVWFPAPQPCRSEFRVLGLFHLFANFHRRSSLGLTRDFGGWHWLTFLFGEVKKALKFADTNLFD